MMGLRCTVSPRIGSLKREARRLHPPPKGCPSVITYPLRGGCSPFPGLFYPALPEIVWVLGRTWVVPKGVPSFVRRGLGRENSCRLTRTKAPPLGPASGCLYPSLPPLTKGRNLKGAHTKA